jgi:hypothetical protein
VCTSNRPSAASPSTVPQRPLRCVLDRPNSTTQSPTAKPCISEGGGGGRFPLAVVNRWLRNRKSRTSVTF